MSIPSNKPNDSQQQAIPGSVDELRARFERAGRQGQRPRIEDFLARCPVDDRGRLFRILLLLELARQRKAGEAPAPDEFLRRFPEQAQVIAAVFAAPGVVPAVPLAEMVGTDGDEPATRVFAAPRAVAAPLSEQFGRYRIVRLLKQGGMGTVYLAHDLQLDRDVAIKVPRLESADRAAIQRFLNSARAAAAVRHRTLVPILEAGEIAGTPYLTMPYLQGETLAERLRKGPLEVQEVVRLVGRLALGMQAAHQKGVLHRDLKPANVLLMPNGEPVLLDFGLARQQGSARETTDGQILGTPGYIAPELLTGQVGQDTPASDIFSLGVILYECLTAQMPFGRTLREVMQRLLTEELVRPSRHRSAVPAALDAVCAKALARQPGARYASMAELADDLTRAFQMSLGRHSGAEKLSQSGQARPPFTAEIHLGSWRKRPRLVLAAIGVVLLGLVIPLGWWCLQPNGRHKLNRDGAFDFPQSKAEVLCDRKDLRLSVWNDISHLYVQAIVWADGDDSLGETADGRAIGDKSTLCLDIDADQRPTANVDRNYHLNPWPILPGLRYQVVRGHNTITPIMSDSMGKGAIRYLDIGKGQKVRVDSFVIPLAEIGKKPGEKIRLAYFGNSPKPSLSVNSIGEQIVPMKMFHEIILADRPASLDFAAVPDGRLDQVPLPKKGVIDGPGYLLAQYRFNGNGKDETGANPDFQLRNTSFKDNALYLNGVDGSGWDRGGNGNGYLAVCRTPKLDYSAFTVALRFRAEEFDSRKKNLLTGGTYCRWFGLSRSLAGNLTVTLNNQSFSHEVKGAALVTGKWTVVACAVDLKMRKIVVRLNGKNAGDIDLPADFKLEVAALPAREADKVWSFTNHASETVFHGLVDELILYGKALSPAELAAVPLRP